jgi:hypothetical protein
MALSDDKRNLYVDLPLNRQRREVGVLALCESRDDSPVEFSMKTISLFNGAASFNALSYVWGDANDKTRIIVSQLLITVLKSLTKCLQNLRHNYSTKSP